MGGKTVISVEGLRKVYGSVIAVDGLSVQVREGEIFGMVGPNGAGKTTTIECIEGLRQPDGGRIEVLGFNPLTQNKTLRQKLGIQLQESALQGRLKVWEALDLFASFYERSLDWHTLLHQLNLTDKKDTPFDKLSGGQKQRLFIALSLINDPELVFFDELTTGLDPQARHNMWDLVRSIRDRGKTILLTTHFMEEAERLCDRVAIIDGGRIVALDTPEKLIRSLEAENRVVFMANGEFDADEIGRLTTVSRVDHIGERYVVYGKGDRLVVDVVNVLAEKGVNFRDLRTEQPSLEDVFLTLTGKEMRR
ncbi:ABC transporter ATP-binding protein [bacterium]|nr:ABC transporter ATP-binding protein [bacterium]